MKNNRPQNLEGEIVFTEHSTNRATDPKIFLSKKKRNDKTLFEPVTLNAESGIICDPNHLNINEVTFLVNESCLVLFWDNVVDTAFLINSEFILIDETTINIDI